MTGAERSGATRWARRLKKVRKSDRSGADENRDETIADPRRVGRWTSIRCGSSQGTDGPHRWRRRNRTESARDSAHGAGDVRLLRRYRHPRQAEDAARVAADRRCWGARRYNPAAVQTRHAQLSHQRQGDRERAGAEGDRAVDEQVLLGSRILTAGSSG